MNLRSHRSGGDNVIPTSGAAGGNRRDRLSDRADLVELDKHGVRRILGDPFLDKLGIGDVEIVANDLNEPAELGGLRLKGGPIVLVKSILDRDDREPFDPVGVERLQSVARQGAHAGLVKLYEPSLQNEEAAGSRAIAICSPGT